jgi:apolipoprotein N-acyltransferase
VSDGERSGVGWLRQTGTPRTLGQLLLAALSGCGYFVGFVGFDVWPLIFVFLVPVLWAIRDVTPRRAVLLGAVAGLVANFGGYYWVIHLLQEFADLSLAPALLGWFLLCAYQGFLVGVFIGLTRLFTVRLGWPVLASVTLTFPFAETYYPLLFPSYVGNALYQVPVLTQIVELFGMLGLTVLITLVNGVIYELLVARVERRPIARREVLPALGYIGFAIVFGLIRLPQIDARTAAAPTAKVGIVQTNLGARDKAEKSSEFIRRHQQMTRELLATRPDLDLVVWPESAYNRYIRRDAKNLSKEVTPGIQVPVILGALTYEKGKGDRRNVYNTAVLTSSTGDVIGMFDKIELLAFGETLPFRDTLPQLQEWFPRSSFFTRGKSLDHFQISRVGKVLPMICYEDIIPDFVRRMWRASGPPAALVNITNDSWYGDTHEPIIHLVLASFRSIETRRAMIRSTNTGISAFIDPAGRITKRTGQWTQETLVHEVPLFEDGLTPLYQYLGDAIGRLGLFYVVLGLGRIWLRRGAPNKR